MPKLPELHPRKVEARLLTLGFVFEKQKGSHRIYSQGARYITVPFHKVVKKGTLHAIIKQSGVSAEMFLGK